MEKIKIPISAALGAATAWLGYVWELFAFVIAFMILDYITGWLAGRANEGINSRKATKGLIKKSGFFLLLVMGFALDLAFNHFILRGLNYQLPFDMPIGLIIACWIVVTEAISICENLNRLGVPIPKFMEKLLRKTRNKIDDGGNDSEHN